MEPLVILFMILFAGLFIVVWATAILAISMLVTHVTSEISEWRRKREISEWEHNHRATIRKQLIENENENR